MTRILSGFSLFLICSLACAQNAATEPAVESNMMGFIGFGVLFLVMCVGFVWLVIWNDKKQKARELLEQDAAQGKTA
jgi:hypothetical protein